MYMHACMHTYIHTYILCITHTGAGPVHFPTNLALHCTIGGPPPSSNQRRSSASTARPYGDRARANQAP